MQLFSDRKWRGQQAKPLPGSASKQKQPAKIVASWTETPGTDATLAKQYQSTIMNIK